MKRIIFEQLMREANTLSVATQTVFSSKFTVKQSWQEN